MFTFEIKQGVEIPAASAGSTTSHPFPWDDMKAGSSFTVPATYWTEERGVRADKFKTASAREKIKSSFKRWQALDKKRAKVMIQLRVLNKDGDIGVWMANVAGDKASATASPKPAADAKKAA